MTQSPTAKNSRMIPALIAVVVLLSIFVERWLNDSGVVASQIVWNCEAQSCTTNFNISNSKSIPQKGIVWMRAYVHLSPLAEGGRPDENPSEVGKASVPFELGANQALEMKGIIPIPLDPKLKIAFVTVIPVVN